MKFALFTLLIAALELPFALMYILLRGICRIAEMLAMLYGAGADLMERILRKLQYVYIDKKADYVFGQ